MKETADAVLRIREVVILNETESKQNVIDSLYTEYEILALCMHS